MTADDYAKVIEASLAMKPTPGPWECFYKRKYDEWHVSLPLQGQSMRLALFDNGCPTERPEADASFIAACHPEALHALLEEREAMQAKIDALMLEFCPGEMTAEQLERWASHQKAALTTTADNQPETGKE